MYDAVSRLLLQSPIGYEGSEWSLYEYVKSSPIRLLDPSGMACHLCVTLESVKAEKDAKGNVIGSVLKYKFDNNKPPRVVAGKACPKECEPVADCLDIPDLDKMKVIKLKEPKWKGYPWARKAYCPPPKDWDQGYCFGVNAKNCKGDWDQDFKDCRDMCKNGKPAKYLCKGIKVPVLKQLCEAMVKGSVENCIYYCENQRVKRDDD